MTKITDHILYFALSAIIVGLTYVVLKPTGLVRAMQIFSRVLGS